MVSRTLNLDLYDIFPGHQTIYISNSLLRFWDSKFGVNDAELIRMLLDELMKANFFLYASSLLNCNMSYFIFVSK